MSIDIDPNTRDPRRNKVFAGTLLLAIGVIIMIHQLNFFFFPWWIFDWPMWIIAFGLYSGFKHDFKNSAWFIMIFVGLFFLCNDIFPRVHVGDNFWPLILIVIGIRMIMFRNSSWKVKGRWVHTRADRESYKNFGDPGSYTSATTEPITPNTDEPADNTSKNRGAYGDDYLDAVSIFGGAKKRILSKDFKGGEIVNIFGGADIDFTQADITGRVIIDVTQVFGGIKLIVPPHWHVTSDMVALFAGFDDKRMMKSDYGSDKVLVLKGTSIFAGVDIRSY